MNSTSTRPAHLEVADIRADVLRLAALATEAIPRGTDVLLTMDLELAQRLIEDDDIADALTIRIEERCDHFLAREQPVAGDLREIVTALRLATDIERSIDLMVNVAKATRRLYGVDLPPLVRGLIERMSEEAARLFRLAVDAYAEGNAALAAALDDMDDRLDELCSDFVHAVFQAHDDGNGLPLPACVQLALIGRYYERIGDHAVTVADSVQYLVTGWRPEQNGAARRIARDTRVHETERLDAEQSRADS